MRKSQEYRARMRRQKTEKSTVQRAAGHPTIRNLEWAAGFLEGEGYFGNEGRSERIHAAQTTREPLERLQSYFGGNIGMHRWKPAKPSHNPTYAWRVFGARARGIMMTLYPLLSARRQKQIVPALKK